VLRRESGHVAGSKLQKNKMLRTENFVLLTMYSLTQDTFGTMVLFLRPGKIQPTNILILNVLETTIHLMLVKSVLLLVFVVKLNK
jgi:hypothetical protein